MHRMLGLLAVVCLIAAVSEVRADRRHTDRAAGNYYQHHVASPRLIPPPYPGRYRDYALRYHYERNTIFHGGPYYHVYHGPYLFRLDRPYHLGYGPPRSEWKRGVRNF
ncbi:MAG: hypothetical protein DWQ31_18750 [Planctomycetota bacterium]|nr:MAG: hypothetical protein DWQ31_18750 [Planctomycetota bacterium]REJ95043.1 MAG: hypothetical protein DWQ35_07260 [Planctomycetota bacterium]REK25266.1 MAG: hypothetical protein DWQ42_11730 [Planctomycetota bacterium]REK40575.1 MAG: hypothetical protein DWQ46_16010 [Planctomycetota bacterium]